MAQASVRVHHDIEARVARSISVKRLVLGLTQHVNREAKRKVPVRTGNLRRSISYAVSEENGAPVGIVKASAFYAAFVEFGTSRMSPRPFLRPALGTIEGYLKGLGR